MFKNNEYNENDFSENYTLYKGKQRNVLLDNWTFDRFNQCFYKEKGEQTLSIYYKDSWILTLCDYANVCFMETYDDLTDAFIKGNELI